jgi:hypothetical protein
VTSTTVALTSRDQRAALLALTVALLASVLIADPLPPPAALGVRLVAVLLAATVLRVTFAEWAATSSDGARQAGRARMDGGDGLPPGFGWPAQVLLGAAAAIVGLGLAAGLLAAAGGPTGAAGSPVSPLAVLSGTGLAFAGSLFIATLAAAPAVLGTGPRRVIGTLLLLQAAVELRIALAGPPSVLEHLVIGALIVVVATGVALVAVPVTQQERAA